MLNLLLLTAVAGFCFVDSAPQRPPDGGSLLMVPAAGLGSLINHFQNIRNNHQQRQTEQVLGFILQPISRLANPNRPHHHRHPGRPGRPNDDRNQEEQSPAPESEPPVAQNIAPPPSQPLQPRLSTDDLPAKSSSPPAKTSTSSPKTSPPPTSATPPPTSAPSLIPEEVPADAIVPAPSGSDPSKWPIIPLSPDNKIKPPPSAGSAPTTEDWNQATPDGNHEEVESFTRHLINAPCLGGVGVGGKCRTAV